MPIELLSPFVVLIISLPLALCVMHQSLHTGERRGIQIHKAIFFRLKNLEGIG
jgi:hypothetical protein